MRTTAGADAAYANDRPPRDATFIKRHARRRRHHPGQGQRRVGHLAQPVRRHQLQSLRHRALGRHVEQRIGHVGGRQPGDLRDCRGDRRLDPPPDQEQQRRRSGADAGTGEPQRDVRRRLQHAHRPDLPHGEGRRHGARRDRRLRPEGRAHRLQRRPHADRRRIESFASETRLDGVRIGVLREYMDRSLFNEADEESIAAAERAIADLQKLGATIVDPGPGGALLQKYIDKYAPSVMNKLFIERFPKAFPIGRERQADGRSHRLAGGHVSGSVAHADGVTLRSLGQGGQSVGESRYMIELLPHGARRRQHQDDEGSRPRSRRRSPTRGPTRATTHAAAGAAARTTAAR